MQIYLFNGKTAEIIPESALQQQLMDSGGTLWVDIPAATESDLRHLAETFKFHPLTIEDTRNQEQRAKIEEYDEYTFLIFNTVTLKGYELTARELDIFVGANYVVTVHQHEEPVIGETLRRLKDPTRRVKMSPGLIVYTLLDAALDAYFPLMEKFGDHIEDIEDSVLQNPSPKMLADMMSLKRSLRELWRVAWPEQAVLNYIMHHNLVFDEENSLDYYFRDVYDHLLRIADSVNTMRDTLSSVIDLYMSSVSNRLNLVVQRLTLITIGIGVMTVITGFYGMNFERTWPPFNDPNGVPYVIGLIIVLELALLLFIRLRRL